MSVPPDSLTDEQVQSFEREVIDPAAKQGNEYAEAWASKLNQAQTPDDKRAVISACLNEARNSDYRVLMGRKLEVSERIRTWDEWKQLVENWRKQQQGLG